MNEIVFVFASAAEKNPKKLFSEYNINFDYDIFYLCSDASKEKVLKKDIDNDISLLQQYKVICPIGAEPLKYVCGMTGITKYNGHFIENKYLPIINPGLTVFKPQYKEDIKKAIEKINNFDMGKLTIEKADKDYRHITTEVDFEAYLEEVIKAPLVVIDLETTALSSLKGDIIGVAMSTKIHQGIFVDFPIFNKYAGLLIEIFKTKKAIFHNAKFDMNWLLEHTGIKFFDFEDTMLLHYCLDETLGTHGLKQLALKYTDLGDYEKELDDYKKEWCRKSKIKLADFNYGMLPIDILCPYAQKDADGTYQLYTKFRPIVDKNERFSKLYNTILIPATKALMTLERNGGPIDVEGVFDLADQYDADIEDCIIDIKEDPAVERFERIHKKDFNPASTLQLREIFFNIKGLTPLKRTETGAYSTDKETLEYLDDPLADAILDMRGKTKMRGTYLENIMNGIDRDKRLRSSFNITGTTSGRLSSSGTINYQNIPRDNKDIKKLFKAREGFKIVQLDLGTAEVYYAAVLSNDEFLQHAFVNKLDFHSYIAKQIFNLDCKVEEVKTLYSDYRQYSKAITFGIMYQAGPRKIAETADISYEEAKQFINKYFREARNLKVFIDQSNGFIERNAFIYSFFGRKRRLPESLSPNRGVAGHAIRSGVNFLVQSVASDVNLLGLIDTLNWIEEKGYNNDIIPFTVVHDSIVAEVREDLIDEWVENLVKFIQTDRGISIPECPIGVDIEVGPSWGEVTKYKSIK